MENMKKPGPEAISSCPGGNIVFADRQLLHHNTKRTGTVAG